jgi:hypothetical protein
MGVGFGRRSFYLATSLPLRPWEDAVILAKLDACFSWVKLIGIAARHPARKA